MMMHFSRALLVALALCAAACAQPKQQSCDMSVETPVHFSSDEETDTLTARTIGARCDRTFALLTIESHEGDAIWSWTAPTANAFGDQFHNADAAALSQFLAGWAAPVTGVTTDAPAWPEQAPALPEGAFTTLDRAVYEDVRARSLPMLCHLASVGRQTCLYWEPAAARAIPLLERDARETAG